MNHAKEHITEVGEQPDTLAHTAAPAEPHEIDQAAVGHRGVSQPVDSH